MRLLKLITYYMSQEIWKDIPGYEFLYQASNLGRIKSLERYKKNNGKDQKVEEKIKNIFDNGNGYKTVSLSKDGKSKLEYIHRLVALSFLDNPESKKQINHKNGIREDNRLENIEWCTSIENNNHKFKVLGYKKLKGLDSKISRPVKQFTIDGIFIKEYGGIREAERALGINKATNIYRVCRGQYSQCMGYKWKYS